MQFVLPYRSGRPLFCWHPTGRHEIKPAIRCHRDTAWDCTVTPPPCWPPISVLAWESYLYFYFSGVVRAGLRGVLRCPALGHGADDLGSPRPLGCLHLPRVARPDILAPGLDIHPRATFVDGALPTLASQRICANRAGCVAGTGTVASELVYCPSDRNAFARTTTCFSTRIESRCVPGIHRNDLHE